MIHGKPFVLVGSASDNERYSCLLLVDGSCIYSCNDTSYVMNVARLQNKILLHLILADLCKMSKLSSPLK